MVCDARCNKVNWTSNYGNNITANNIIDGVIKLADDDNAASIFSKLNTSVNHNKQQVTLHAWRQHPDLYEKIAYGIYEFGHNLTKTSVRCEHFLPHAVAVEINYNISTYAHFLEHFKGWRQLLQELLGQDYGRLLQARNEKRQHGTSPSTSASETFSITMVRVNR